MKERFFIFLTPSRKKRRDGAAFENSYAKKNGPVQQAKEEKSQTKVNYR